MAEASPSPSAATGRAAVFFDRDGVINRFPGVDKFVLRWGEFHLLEGVPENLLRLRARGYFLALASNQSCVGRGLLSAEALEEIHRLMQAALGPARLDALYVCPHHPGAGCPCRKPAPHMLLRAAAEHGLDLARSFMLGDSGRDIEMGRAAGCRTILCREDLPASPEALKPQHRPEHMCRTLTEAVDWILQVMRAAG